MSSAILADVSAGIRHAMAHPFGIDFVVRENRIYIPFGSAINCLGYNDFLERIIGVTRVAFALFILATTDDRKYKIIAGGHVFRGLLEMMGSFELYLLVLDAAFTVYNIGMRVWNSQPQKTG